jgi:glycosyltransferase involved in cell wall biosynthesis
MNNLPFVSIIIPCQNEEKYIGKCLDSIIAQDYPKDKLEVLVVDGMSEDGTKEIVSQYSKNYPFIALFNNSKKVTPVAMNIGIRNARGDIIILVNAHSILDKEFVKFSIKYLQETRADAVGGMLNTINEEDSTIASAIPWAVDSIFGSGGKRYRNREIEGFVNDTLPYCAYPKKIIEKMVSLMKT